ncbi:MAG TPA: hypothetical protein PKV80_24090, partial [Leptospiraceae bacterium]|nr:hypothetical protein [Leptospiraceae bacterium]
MCSEEICLLTECRNIIADTAGSANRINRSFGIFDLKTEVFRISNEDIDATTRTAESIRISKMKNRFIPSDF